MAGEYEWMLKGDCVEGCTSPPVCPAMWNSPVQIQFHNGRSECEGVWSFSIREGYYKDIDLSGLKAMYAFNSPSPFPPKEPEPWVCIIYIDSNANEDQAKALEEILRKCWKHMGEVLKVKRAPIIFKKELIKGGPLARHEVISEGLYHLVASPFKTKDGRPRYINSLYGGHINIGISKVNKFNDPDLPRGKWDAPGMSSTYYEFIVHPEKLYWFP